VEYSFEYRPVSQAMGLRDVRLGQDRFHFGDRERMAGQTPLIARQDQVARRIVFHDVLAHQPDEEAPQGREPMRLAREAQRLAVFLAVVVHVALEPLEDRERHRVRPGDAPLQAPAEEVRQGRAAHFHGAGGIMMRLHPQQVAVHEGREPLRIARIARQGSTSVGTHDQVSNIEDRKKIAPTGRRYVSPGRSAAQPWEYGPRDVPKPQRGGAKREGHRDPAWDVRPNV